jgi:hypothetical protein
MLLGKDVKMDGFVAYIYVIDCLNNHKIFLFLNPLNCYTKTSFVNALLLLLTRE